MARWRGGTHQDSDLDLFVKVDVKDRPLVHAIVDAACEISETATAYRPTLPPLVMARDAGSFKGAVSRAYHGARNHARALLLSEGIEAKSRGGVQHRVHQTFVRDGRLEPAVARILQRLEGDRLEADHDAASVYTDEMAREAVHDAERYGDSVRAVLAAAGFRC